ncbi:MAG: alanine racemase [Rhodospirillaceae bacterium]|nr:alanine racemase [Rhodospirillaceae bacterium]
MSDPNRAGALLTIDLDAVAGNYRRVSAMLRPGTECAGVVKADGYGCGAAPVARRLFAEGCRRFFVARPDEAFALRPLLPAATVAVFDGLLPGLAADYAAAGIVPVLGDPGQVAAWAARAAAIGARLPAILHVDTGMNRYGLSPRDALALAEAPDALAAFADLAMISHLVVSEEPGHPLNAQQLAAYRALRARFPAARASLANSSGIFLGPDYHFDFVRPGHALYGGNPTPHAPNPMQAVVRLDARILQVREVDSPGTVGYGATAPIGAGGRIATIAVGYADGYLRSLSNRGEAWIGPHNVPVIGRVSMDLVTLDVSSVPRESCRVGDWVELIGPHLGVDAVAERAGTNGYEILTSLGPRYRRTYLGEAA